MLGIPLFGCLLRVLLAAGRYARRCEVGPAHHRGKQRLLALFLPRRTAKNLIGAGPEAFPSTFNISDRPSR